LNPDGELPARPGSFQYQGDTKWQVPHSFTSKFEGKAIAMVGRPIVPIHRLARCLLLRPQNRQYWYRHLFSDL